MAQMTLADRLQTVLSDLQDEQKTLEAVIASLAFNRAMARPRRPVTPVRRKTKHVAKHRRHFSPEHRARISAGIRRHWRNRKHAK